MELNREQIVKALEHCGSDEGTCEGCPYCVTRKDGALLPCHITADALALIREQAEENDRLRAETIDYRNIPYIIAEAKADTIRKIQERMMDTKTKICGDYYIYAENVNVIAQELLGE